jgi:hypothetical protein
MANRRHSPKRVKRLRHYDTLETAQATGASRQTARRWRKEGLRTVEGHRPPISRGEDIIAFLKQREAKRKRPCGPGRFAFVIAALVATGAQAADLPSQTLPAPWSAAPCFASFSDYFNSSPQDCPLTWNGITFYGRIDVGVGYESHGVPFNAFYPNGTEELISKNSNGSRYSLVPNGLGQSFLGIKGNEQFAPDWSFIFDLQTGFDPYSLQRARPEVIGRQQFESSRFAKRKWRFEPCGAAFQHGRLCRLKQQDIRHADRGSARLSHFGRLGPL